MARVTWSSSKNIVLLIAFLLGFSLFPNISAVVPSGSSLTVGENGYVSASQDTEITIYAADISNNSIAGASVVLQIDIVGSSTSGIINGGGVVDQEASIAVEYSPTNSTGYMVLTWTVPSVTQDTTAEINATVIDGTDSYNLPSVIVVITNNVLKLDVTNVNLVDKIYSNFNTSVTISAQNFIGGEYTAVDVSLSPIQGTFSTENGKLNSQGIFQTVWTAPEVTSAQNITIEAVFQTVSGSIYTASETVEVRPVDLETSTITSNSTSVEAESTVSLQVKSSGLLQILPYTNGTVNQLSGEIVGDFSATSFITNSTGYADLTWTAPRVTGVQEITIEVILSYGATTQRLEINITVSPIIYDITVQLNSTNVDPDELVEIVVFVSENGIGVSGAKVIVDVSEGTITPDFTFTNSSGFAILYWRADFIPIEIIGTNVEFTISAFDNSTAPGNVIKSVHVKPYPTNYPSAVVLPKTEFTIFEPVDMSVVVLNSTNSPYEGAVVTLSALAGTFKSSNDTTAVNVTDNNGFADFTWLATGLSDPSEPQILRFDYEISVSKSNFQYSGNFTITIVPSNTSSSNVVSGDTSTAVDDSTSIGQDPTIIIAGAIGVVAVGAIVAIVRRRS